MDSYAIQSNRTYLDSFVEGGGRGGGDDVTIHVVLYYSMLSNGIVQHNVYCSSSPIVLCALCFLIHIYRKVVKL